MPSEQEWVEAFERLEKGKSSYEAEAKRLGVGKGTVHRRHTQYLDSQVESLRTKRTSLEEAVGGITDEYKRKRQEEEAKLQSALGQLKAKLEKLADEYEKRRQEEEAKLRETLGKQEQESRRRLEKIDAELRAKDAIISEFKRRGLDPIKGLQILKRYSNLDQALGQINREIEEKRGRADKLKDHTKSLVTGIGEKEGHWGELTTKLRLAGQMLQRKQVEDQQMEGELSRKSVLLSQLLDRIRELGDAKSELNAEVRELGEKRDALEEAFDADKKAFDADRASLEEKNATLRNANSELEGMVKGYLQVIDEMKKAEKQREARASAELKKRETEADREFERRQMEVDENIRKRIEEGKTMVEEAVRKETAELMARSAEELETQQRDRGRLTNQQEELRIQNIAMGVQLGEASATIELLKKKIKELKHD